ncbi:MAG: protein-disulfide reductase DsbD family protein, partial [Sphingobium sp.]
MLVAALTLGVAAALAQTPLGGDGPHIHPQLVAESREPAPGGTVTLAIVMRPEAGWHGYWVNPGDAGLDMDVRWTVPAGAAVGPLRYPAPQRLLISGLMNHVYEGPYALVTDLKLPAGLKPGQALPIRADARWLACTDKLCVPERAALSLDLKIGDGQVSIGNRRIFDNYRVALPRPLGREARYLINKDRIRIAIPYPAAAPVEAPWFYASTRDRIAYAEPQRASRIGDMLVVETRAAGGGPAGGVLEGVIAVA